MKRSYYLFNPGKLSRKDNTLQFTSKNEAGEELEHKYIPIETVDNLYVFGNIDANSSMFNFLGKEQINAHFFDYYEHYTGSFFAKDYLLAGKVLIAQVQHYSNKKNRLIIAQKLVAGAAFNMLKNLKYYNNREKDTTTQINKIEQLIETIENTSEIDQLMGIEGNIKMTYYEAFDIIINDFKMGNRTKMPPNNEINCLISFLNTMCYTLSLDMIYHTQLNPTISYLHEPGTRRYSLALDLAEIFKPLLADRLIFSLLNKKQIQATDFNNQINACLLNEKGKKTIVKAWDEKLAETIKHRGLSRNVSYKHLVKLECYKLSKHILNIEEYKPFKTWW